MDLDAGSTTHSMMVNQVQQLIKAAMNSSNAVAQAIRQSNQEGFAAVRSNLDSIYDVVSKMTPERDIVMSPTL